MISLGYSLFGFGIAILFLYVLEVLRYNTSSSKIELFSFFSLSGLLLPAYGIHSSHAKAIPVFVSTLGLVSRTFDHGPWAVFNHSG